MKQNLFLILSIVLLLPCCKSENDKNDPPPIIHMSFAPREANYVWVKPSVENDRFKIVICSYNQMLQNGSDYTETWQQIDSSIPEIETAIKNVERSELAMDYIPFGEQAEYVEREKHNPNIRYIGPVLPRLIEYRTDEIVSLRITADRNFLGETPGILLNSHFRIYAAFTFPCWFPVLSKTSGSYVGEEYLKRRSLNEIAAQRMVVPACAVIDLFENESLTEEELQATITVEMTTKSGKSFRASHKIESSCRSIFPDGFHDNFICSIDDEYLATRIDE